MESGALHARDLFPSGRAPDGDANRDPDAQPHRDVSGQHSRNRAQRGSESDA